MRKAIYWFRRDLRITDNAALSAASRQAEHVVPVYVLGEWKLNHRWTGANRQHFLCGCLAALENDLRTIGGRLVLRQGDPVAELEKLAVETGAEAIFFNRDPDLHPVCESLAQSSATVPEPATSIPCDAVRNRIAAASVARHMGSVRGRTADS